MSTVAFDTSTAATIVAATVVEPQPPAATSAAKLPRFTFTGCGAAASRSRSARVIPTRTTPSRMPIVAGMASWARTASSSAAATRTPIIPIHVRFASAWRLNTWDRFVIPKPFSRVHVIFDHPLTVAPTAEAAAFEAERQRIEAALRSGVDDLDPDALP